MKPNDIAMQTRCVYCLGEQYVHSVIDVSYGEAGCAWCGMYSHIMTRTEYADTLAAARQRQAEADARQRNRITHLPRQRATE